MKTLLVLLTLTAAVAVSATSAQAFCLSGDCLRKHPGPVWAPNPGIEEPDASSPCPDGGKVVEELEPRYVERGGILYVVHRWLCDDGITVVEGEEETAGGGISYDPPPETSYPICPGPDDPAYDPNNPDCW